MSRMRFWLAVAFAVAWALPCAAEPLSAYGNLPTVEQMAISPSGRLLAIDFTKGEQRTIVIQDLVARKIVTGIKVGPIKVRQIEWAGDDHLLVTSSATSSVVGLIAARQEWFVVADLNIPANRFTPLLTDLPEMSGLNAVFGYPQVRYVGGKAVVYVVGVHFAYDGGGATLYRITLDTDRSNMVEVGDARTEDMLVGADGRPQVEVEQDPRFWGLRVFHDGFWHDAQGRQITIESPDLVGLGRDGKSILIAQREGESMSLREVSPDGSTVSDPLPVDHWDSLLTNPVDQRLIGTVDLVGDTFRTTYFDPNDQATWDAVAAAFPGSQVTPVSESNDRQKRVVHVDSPTDGPGFALVDLADHSTVWLGNEYSGLGEDDIGPVMPVSYKAADGLEITGYLTLPRHRNPRKLPLVVLVHGGPSVRDEPGFDWWSEGMASAGYAVLRVNYRGSGGFGWKFMSAGFGEWGQKMQTDVSDGVRFLAAQGAIDPARVCIVGASYGGYAAAAGPTLDPGVYRCAVDAEGPVEMGKFIAWGAAREGYYGLTTQRYWDRFMGAKDSSDPHLVAISPADHADKVTVPFLIIHGKDDTVVPFEQSQMMADALKAAGKPYDFVILNHEDHWLSHADTRLQLLQSIVDFLVKNNPPDPPGS